MDRWIAIPFTSSYLMNNTRRPYLMSQSTGDYKGILFAASRQVCSASLFIKMGFFTSAASWRQQHHLGNGTLIFYIGSGRGVLLQPCWEESYAIKALPHLPRRYLEDEYEIKNLFLYQKQKLLIQRQVLKQKKSPSVALNCLFYAIIAVAPSAKIVYTRHEVCLQPDVYDLKLCDKTKV